MTGGSTVTAAITIALTWTVSIGQHDETAERHQGEGDSSGLFPTKPGER
jgi:hypothetical protein